MCTVSFIVTKQGVHITSNREERLSRQAGMLPKIYHHSGCNLLYPKDGEKGGTWIAAKENGDAAVLLNGAFVAHASTPPYRSSRGQILIEIIADSHPVACFSQISLDGIEPFTLVLYTHRKLYECRWDGGLKALKSLSLQQTHLWSSCTLYTPEVAVKRRQWFDAWLKENPLPDTKSIRAFHRYGGEGDSCNDLFMKRNGAMGTVSITSLLVQKNFTTMHYWDATTGKAVEQMLQNKNTAPIQSSWWQRFFIRLRHWEYWPFHVVYFPVYFYWFWLCIKARSFFFSNTANPGIRNGGFLMESKKEIYDLMPIGSYPTTALLHPGDWNEALAENILQENNLSFPLIAKPDIGLRGLGVKLLQNRDEWKTYHQSIPVDYLLQQYVTYPNEAGIFYYRMPGEPQGHITGVVDKEFLSVKGDGFSTLHELLLQDERFLLQLPVLQATYGDELSEVLPAGKNKLLVPYGNHCRGAKFLDHTGNINESLEQTIDTLCKQVKGFYFGRLDVRYQTWEELCDGKAFSVIELNGSGSEPAHIYDPRHSILFGWKEIMRHHRILYNVSRAGKKHHGLPFMTTKEGLQMLRDNNRHIEKLSQFSQLKSN